MKDREAHADIAEQEAWILKQILSVRCTPHSVGIRRLRTQPLNSACLLPLPITNFLWVHFRR